MERLSGGPYWVQKIKRNGERDRRVTGNLEALGWAVVRIWESELLADPEEAMLRVVAKLENQRQ